MLTPMDLLPPDALARLLEQARMSVQTGTEGTEVPEDEEDDDFHGGPTQQADHARAMRGLVGLRFCAAVYGSAARPEGLVAASFAGWASETWADGGPEPADSLAAAVKSCAPRIAEVPGLAERLARSSYVGVRKALAQSIAKSEVSVLQVLARDANRDVREAANKRLDVSLRSDAFPISTEGHDEAVLAKARRILELPTHEYLRHADEALVAMQPLSDALAVAVWERLLLASHVGAEYFWPWLGALLERRGGEHAFTRMLGEWHRADHSFYVAYGFEKKMGEVSAAARKRTIDALFAALQEAPREGHLRTHIAQCAAHLVTPRYDRMKLLEAVLGVPVEKAAETEPDPNYPSYVLAKPLAAEGIRGRLRTKLVAALHDGKRGRWTHVPHTVWLKLGPDPRIREEARRKLEVAEKGKVDELIGTVLQHRIPALDGTEAKLVASLYVRPEWRGALIRRTKAGKALARRSILRGELAVADLVDFALSGIDGKAPESPASDRLWAAVRKTRDAALKDAFTLDLCSLVRPGHTWEASDLALAQRACAALAANESVPGSPLHFIRALERLKTPETEAMFDELEEKSNDDDIKELIASARELAALMT